jgi:transposase-like protein
MDQFNISAYLYTLKKGMKSYCSQGPLGIFLLELIGQELPEPEYFDDTKISRLIKHSVNVKETILTAIAEKKYRDWVYERFNDNVQKDFNVTTIGNTCLRINGIFQREPNIVESEKATASAYLHNSNYPDFLAFTFIKALGMQNTNEEKTEPTTDELPYLTEAHGKCPVCGKPLIVSSRGKNIHNYEVTQIYNDDFDDDIKEELNKASPKPIDVNSSNNKIILCLDHLNEYLSSPSVDMYLSLLNKRKIFNTEKEIDKELSKLDFEESVSQIIIDLGAADLGHMTAELKLDPKEIKDKIRPENSVLHDDILNWVTKYYKYIEKRFSELNGEGFIRFTKVATQVQATYEALEAYGTLDQYAIFDRIANWMKEKLNYDDSKRSMCIILTAFFVQNCEVFHEFSK